MSQHVNALGNDIDRCIQSYNKVVGSLERRVLVSARKFKELGVSRSDTQESLTVAPIDAKPRSFALQNSEKDL